ncbi:MAG TPA: roadblock/LC7 domain-containing protein [candidate division Zixibacteria bacterium]|mgnify:FL=1|nr:roadblock/LC7 domain-containing protein [candidate division Zixibacteria bacterium]MDD4917093.1 roadblock/LC7 domain-containing protein [candidate division Zixibacteria bacterium]MDM7972925.1 roadblock/LC7 domain-containing protein [candidate division Zixibacteria bacterium]HOD65319.1 roadblock/LC7 domain-containing protein [candidate division Zixibacteria bacterium]HOZ08111.1 roadblock/LC7 domain-containing protein [candidate division Zixibacteria bacterium]
MYEILSELNKTSGVTGSMVVGSDGILIAADLDASFEGETVGALAASITSNIQKSLHRLDGHPLRQVTIESEEAKLFFTDAGLGILVVTTEKDVNVGLIRLEIKNAIERLRTVR